MAILVAEGVDDEGEDFTERSVLTYAGTGPEILGVDTTVQLDRAYEDGLLVEETFDYYAQDTDGNVWYMGEDVTNYLYDDGNLIGPNNDSAWIAGKNGALPGYIMPAAPGVGLIRADEGLDATLQNPEPIFERIAPTPVPLPAALPMLFSGLGGLGALGLGRRWRARGPAA